MYKYTTDKAYFHDMFWTTVHHLHPWAKELVKTLEPFPSIFEKIAIVNKESIPSKLTSASISSESLFLTLCGRRPGTKCDYAKCPFNPKNQINRKNNV